MMKRLPILLLITVSFLTAETIQRERTALREGPGAWYPMVLELGTGASVQVLKQEDSWVKIRYEAKEGYISARSLKGKAASNDVFAQMGSMMASPTVSQSAVTASIKGFAEKMTKRLGGSPDAHEMLQRNLLTGSDFQLFLRNSMKTRDLNKLRRVYPLGYLKKETGFTFSEEGMGLAVASKLVTLGLYEDRLLNQYVNMVGMHVANQSHGYDVFFRFFIIDDKSINGYSCPGGIIFITKGAIDAMKNEAELACFLGHEIAHISARHGMQEMEERKEMIFADNAFAEMSETVNESEEIAAVSRDLDDMALDSYERIFEGRLSDYEEEADKLGLLYAARSGYDPKAMLDYLKRLDANNYGSTNEHYSQSDNQLRIGRLEKHLSPKKWSNKKFMRKEARYKSFTK